MSETSPPNPTTTSSLNFRRRLTSVNRAREPYEAMRIISQSYAYCFIFHTQVVRRNDYAILKLRGEDGGTSDNRTLGVLVRAGSLEV